MEKLSTSTRQVEAVTIVDLSGRISLGEASVVARDVTTPWAKAIRNLFANSWQARLYRPSGIGVLVSGFSTGRGQGGELKLVNLSKRIRDLLNITKLYSLFDVKDDEAAAVASFR